MRIGIHSGTVLRGHIDAVVAEVRRVAEHGLHGYWAPMLTGHDTLAVLAIAGREVGSVELGTAVVPMPLRPPYALAQEAATVQQATGGRLVLGLGPSHEVLVRQAFGLEWPPPLAATRRYLDQLTRIMTADGPQRVDVGPNPVPPVLLGAVNPAMAALAAQRAAGVVTWAAGARTVAQVVAAPARHRPDYRIVVALPICVTDDVAATRQLVDRRLGAHDRLPSYQKVLSREGLATTADLALVGSAKEIGRRLDELAAAGATDFAGHIVATTAADADRTWQYLANRAATAGGS